MRKWYGCIFTIILSVFVWMGFHISVAAAASSYPGTLLNQLTTLAGTSWMSTTTADVITFVDDENVTITESRDSVVRGQWYRDEYGYVIELPGYRQQRFKVLDGLIQIDNSKFTYSLQSPANVLTELQNAVSTMDVDAVMDLIDPEIEGFSDVRSMYDTYKFMDQLSMLFDLWGIATNFSADTVLPFILDGALTNDLQLLSTAMPSLWYNIYDEKMNEDTGQIIASLYINSTNDAPFLDISNPLLIKTVYKNNKWLINDILPYRGELLADIAASENLARTWELSAVWIGNNEITLNEMEELKQFFDVTAEIPTFRIQIRADHTYNARLTLGDESHTEDGTWELNHDKLRLGETQLVSFLYQKEYQESLIVFYEGYSFAFSPVSVAKNFDGDILYEIYTSGDHYYTLNDAQEAVYLGTRTLNRTNSDDSNQKNILQIPKSIDGYAVTEIGNSAFSGRSKIDGIILPESIRIIGRFAFESCGNLRSLLLPDGLETIGSRAFARCSNLQEITIPASVKAIGDDAFSHEMRIIVEPASYAEQYCIDNNLIYEYSESSLDWLH